MCTQCCGWTKSYHKRNKSIYAVREDTTGRRIGTACAVMKKMKGDGRRTKKEYCLLSLNKLAQSDAQEIIAGRFSYSFPKRERNHQVRIASPSEEDHLSYFDLKFRPDNCLHLVDRKLSLEELEVVQAGFSAYTFMAGKIIQLDFKLNHNSRTYDLINVEPELHGFDEKFAIGAPIILELGRTKKDTVIGVLGVSDRGNLVPMFHKDAGVDLTERMAGGDSSPGERCDAVHVQSDSMAAWQETSSAEQCNLGRMQSGGVPSEVELDNLAKEIPECWYSLGIQLCLDRAALDNIHLNNVEHTSPAKKAFQMLVTWRNSGRCATYGELSEALSKVDRHDLAERISTQQLGVKQDCGQLQDPPLREEIMSEYEKQHSWIHPFPWLEHFQLALEDVFTRLKIVVRGKGRRVPSDSTVGMFEIFKPNKYCRRPRRVLVEADPGMGKTTFSKKLCLDWATGRNMQPFPLFPLVLLLKCRDLLSDDIMKAIVDQLLPKDVSKKDKSALLKYVEENQSHILLVVDGMDELRKDVDLSDLIQRKILSKIHLLVTTRHEAGISIRQYFDSLFEITGYTISDAKAYIRKYFEIIKEEDKGERLLDKVDETFDEDGRAKIKDAAYLGELLSNPLRTSLLCAVYEDCGDELPTRRTKLYTEMSECILRRHFKKECPGAELPEDPLLYYRKDLLILGKLAYDGVEKNQLYFDARELKGHSPNIEKFGFLSKEAAASKTKPVLRYSFLHKTFQEYLAAFYVCVNLVNGEIKGKKFVDQHLGDIGKFAQVFIFCAGILAGQRATAVLLSFMESLTQALVKRKAIIGGIEFNFLLLCDCVCECIVGRELNEEQKEVCAVIGKEIYWQRLGLNRDIAGELSNRYKVLCEVLKNNTTVKILDLIDNQLTDVSLLVNSFKHRTTLKWLILSGNPINDLTGLQELVQRNEQLRIHTDRGEIHM